MLDAAEIAKRAQELCDEGYEREVRLTGMGYIDAAIALPEAATIKAIVEAINKELSSRDEE